jgi:hypothetical protein
MDAIAAAQRGVSILGSGNRLPRRSYGEPSIFCMMACHTKMERLSCLPSRSNERPCLMRMITCVLCIAVFAASHASADMTPPPFARRAISHNGQTVVRVVSVKGKDDQETRPKDHVSVYSYSVKKDAYIRVSSFDLGDLCASDKLFVSDDGRFLIFVNIGHWVGDDALGIRVYSKRGKLLKRWNVSDFLTRKQIRASIKTGSTTQWFDDGEFEGHTFRFSGPAEIVRGWGSTIAVMHGGDPRVSYSFSLDLKKLELTED